MGIVKPKAAAPWARPPNGTAGGGNRQPVTSPALAQRSQSTTMDVSLAQPETRPVIFTSRSIRCARHSPMPQMLQTATASRAFHWSGNSPLRMPS